MKRSLGYFVALVLVLFVDRTWSYTELDCISCHVREDSKTGFHININEYRSTVHGQVLDCLDCHQDVKDSSHIEIDDSEKVNCQSCHEQKNLHTPDGSVTCNACHTPHYTYGVHDPRSSVHYKNLRDTCGKCHTEQSQRTSITSTLIGLHIASHPKQDFTRIFSEGLCIGCHQGKGAHGEDMPVNDQDCYKCHMSLVKDNWILGYIHASTDKYSKPVHAFAHYIYIAASLSLVVLLARVFVMFIKKKNQ
jgi:hypothetical protein